MSKYSEVLKFLILKLSPTFGRSASSNIKVRLFNCVGPLTFKITPEVPSKNSLGWVRVTSPGFSLEILKILSIDLYKEGVGFFRFRTTNSKVSEK